MEGPVSPRSVRRTAVVAAVALTFSFGTVPVTAHDPLGGSPGPAPRTSLEHPDRDDQPAAVGIAAAEFAASGFVEEVVFSGLDTPIVVEFASNGRVYVALKDGRILEFSSLSDTTPTTYADLRTNVHDYWDRGLLGMALDPSFASNGRMYVAYTYNAPPGQTAPVWPDNTCPSPPSGPGGNTDGCVVTSRVSALTNGTSEQVLVHDWCQQFPSHSISDIVFDPEGALIVAGGDGANFNNTDYGQYGGSSGSPTPRNPCGDPPAGVGGTQTIPTAEGGALRAQDVRTSGSGDPVGLSGSVIRINPATGAAMADNPSIGASDINARRMIAHGLRNPFRLAIQPGTGELWMGDVGWNTWEEIDRHSDPDGAVRNYGWPCREGMSLQPGSYGQLNLCSSLSNPTLPHYAYNHNAETVPGDGCNVGGGSVSGIAFYPGGSYPDAYDGALFWTDYTRDCMWVMTAAANGVPDSGAVTHFADLDNPVHLQVGPGGDLFYVDIGGSVRRIRYIGTNAAPNAAVSAAPTSGAVPLNVSFSAAGSTDPDGDPLTYAWDFDEDGDGQFNDATTAASSNTYNAAGTYTARVRVSDPSGASDVATITINAGNDPPAASITQPATSLRWSVGEEIAFAGTATDPDGSIPAANYTWQLVLEHCPGICHEHVVGTWTGVKAGTFDAPDHEYPSSLILRLNVRDGSGAEDDVEIRLAPRTVTLDLRSSPAGVPLTAGWVTGETPFAMTVIRGSLIQLTAPAGATADGVPYAFTGWSDGGARSHAITALTSRALTATFAAGYVDVPASSPFFADISWLTQADITRGCATDPPRFCPSSPVTRGQMASFLVRALGLPPSATDVFADDETSVHERDINALASAGITGGCGGTRFCPASPVTRAEMASFLVRALGLPPSATDAFADDETSIHQRDINALASSGITGGCSAGRFCPRASVTREQMAAFLRRAAD